MSVTSFGLDNETLTDTSSLSENLVIHEYEKLEPVSERIKLDGSEYLTGNRRKDK